MTAADQIFPVIIVIIMFIVAAEFCLDLVEYRERKK
jgi:hypothetical protein